LYFRLLGIFLAFGINLFRILLFLFYFIFFFNFGFLLFQCFATQCLFAWVISVAHSPIFSRNWLVPSPLLTGFCLFGVGF